MVKMKNILVLEDDDFECKILKTIINKLERDCYIYECHNCEKAYYISLENPIHLFLVDVRLENNYDFSGFTFIQNIRQISRYNEVPVIFISSLEGYELMAFRKMHCYDFITKPYKEEDIQEIIENALSLKASDTGSSFIGFETGGIYYPIETNSIYYLEANGRTVYVHTDSDIIELSGKSLKECYKLLDKHMFCQVHKSYIISRKYIKKIDFPKRTIYIKNKPGTEKIIIGVKYKDKLHEWLYDI